MVVTFIALHKYASIQMIIFMLLTVINFIYTAVARPYAENNIGEMMNETAILVCVYIMNTFYFIRKPSHFRNTGWAFIAVCGQIILVNVVMMISKIIVSIYNSIMMFKE